MSLFGSLDSYTEVRVNPPPPIPPLFSELAYHNDKVKTLHTNILCPQGASADTHAGRRGGWVGCSGVSLPCGATVGPLRPTSPGPSPSALSFCDPCCKGPRYLSASGPMALFSCIYCTHTLPPTALRVALLPH